MTAVEQVARFWRSLETGAEPSRAEVWSSLAAAFRAVLELRDPSEHLEAVPGSLGDAAQEAWAEVRDLIALQARVALGGREGAASAGEDLAAFASRGAITPATRARAEHQLGIRAIRKGDLLGAERHLMRALAELDVGPEDLVRRSWVCDSYAQVLRGLGAFGEARRTWEGVLRAKAAAGDALGCAISGGALGRLELDLGDASSAARRAEELIDRWEDQLERRSRMRLYSLLLEARLAQPEASIAEPMAALTGLLTTDPAQAHALDGYAHLALARAHRVSGDREASEASLAAARSTLTYPAQQVLVSYWARKLGLEEEEHAQWLARMRELARGSELVFEPEVRIEVEEAERLAALDEPAAALSVLRDIDARVEASNNAALRHLVDAAFTRLAPEEAARRAVATYAGCSMDALAQTRRTDATIVFADLVSFTQRSNELTPEEVMATARGVFELSSEVLARTGVRPLSYLGDGLLAHISGEDHGQRGLDFACEFTRRCHHVTRARRALTTDGDLPLKYQMDVRCGVATGDVVMGVLGNLAKLEFTAIGMTVNLSARLQGQAEPNEVVAQATIGGPWTEGATLEAHELKGVDGAVAAHRIKPTAETSRAR